MAIEIVFIIWCTNFNEYKYFKVGCKQIEKLNLGSSKCKIISRYPFSYKHLTLANLVLTDSFQYVIILFYFNIGKNKMHILKFKF